MFFGDNYGDRETYINIHEAAILFTEVPGTWPIAIWVWPHFAAVLFIDFRISRGKMGMYLWNKTVEVTYPDFVGSRFIEA